VVHPESAKEALKEAEGEAKRAEAAAAALQFESLPGDNAWGTGGGTGAASQSHSSSGWAPTVINKARELVGHRAPAWNAPGKGELLGGGAGAGAGAGTALDRGGGSSFAASAAASDDADLDRAIADSLQMHFDHEAQRRLAQQAAGAGPKEPRPSPQGKGSGTGGLTRESSGEGTAAGPSDLPPDTDARDMQGRVTAHGDSTVQPGGGSKLPLGPANQQAPAAGHPGPLPGGASLPADGQSLRVGEEGVGSAATVQLAIHLPSGERLQRTFRHEDCVEAVVQFVRTRLDTNVGFTLAERGAGGKVS